MNTLSRLTAKYLFSVSVMFLLLTVAGVVPALASHRSIPPTGSIWFGKSFVKANGDLYIKGRVHTVRFKAKVAWVAHFRKPAGSHTVMLTIRRLKNHHSARVHKPIRVTIQNSKATELANAVPGRDFARIGARKPGRYRLTYRRGVVALASGILVLKK